MNGQANYLAQNGIIFSLDHNLKTASVISTSEISGDVLIPTTIIYQKNEYYIVSINEESFKNATIKSFSFENNSRVTTIQKDAFAYSTIESLNIPSSIINLPKGWCRSIVGLKRITIMPQNSKYIFLNNEMILSKDDIKDVNYNILVFARRDIQSVVIPSFINRIDSYAFSECSIESITIPTNVLIICEGAFYNCRKLKHINFSYDSKLEKIEKSAFLETSIQEIKIPAAVSVLGENWCNKETKIIKMTINTVGTFQTENFLQNTTIMRYRMKNGTFSKTILNSSRQHQKIEIIPENKNEFSLFDFITFAYSTYPQFITEPPERSTSKGIYLTLHSKPNKREICQEILSSRQKLYSIRIEIDENFKDIRVFVKDFLNYFNNDDNLLIFNLTAFNYDIFDKILLKQDSCSMLTSFGQYVSNKTVKCPIFLKYSFSKFQSKRTQRYKSKFSSTDNIIKMLQNIPGQLLFRYQQNGYGGYNFKFKNGQISTVNSISWIFPWASEVIQKVHYCQIDGSFKAFPGYSFCIFHGIYFNESIPFAFTLNPTENFQLYNLIFDCLDFYKIDSNIFKGRLVLADMGKQIKLFCQSFNMPRFICHRHLIERFGSNSPIGLMVARLLKSKNESEYLKISAEINAELKIYINYKKTYSQIDSITQKKIDKLKIMLSGLNGKEESNYYIFKWARWLRADFHMGRCSNHAEGAHGNINESINRRGNYNFSTGLSATINYILNYFQNKKTNHGKSFSIRHSKLIEKIINLLSSPSFNYKKYIIGCNCEDEFYNNSLYGVPFPCIHKIIAQIYLCDEIKDFSKLNSINIEDFIIYFLNMKINYSKNFSKEQIDQKVLEICNYYSKSVKINLDKNTTFSFIQKMLTIFCYRLPDPLEFNEDYTKNQFHCEETAPIVIKNNSTKFTKRKEKVKIDDLSFWTRNCVNDIQLLCKSKYYETVKEIIFIYKDIGERAYSICNDNYDLYISEIYLQSEMLFQNENEMPNILSKIGEFKIKCWLDADKLMNDHKFI